MIHIVYIQCCLKLVTRFRAASTCISNLQIRKLEHILLLRLVENQTLMFRTPNRDLDRERFIGSVVIENGWINITSLCIVNLPLKVVPPESTYCGIIEAVY